MNESFRSKNGLNTAFTVIPNVEIHEQLALLDEVYNRATVTITACARLDASARLWDAKSTGTFNVGENETSIPASSPIKRNYLHQLQTGV